ncbi:hypothetical protein KC322_g26 [Hortaea werneckii]|nr:hypothetical protein KC322_g26 [Hortaea werneckii]
MEDGRFEFEARLYGRESRWDEECHVEDASIQVRHRLAQESEVPLERIALLRKVYLQPAAIVFAFIPLVSELIGLKGELDCDLCLFGDLLLADLYPALLLLLQGLFYALKPFEDVGVIKMTFHTVRWILEFHSNERLALRMQCELGRSSLDICVTEGSVAGVSASLEGSSGLESLELWKSSLAEATIGAPGEASTSFSLPFPAKTLLSFSPKRGIRTHQALDAQQYTLQPLSRAPLFARIASPCAQNG